MPLPSKSTLLQQARWPDFLIIGVQKCGTTWLSHMLRQHPRIFLPQGEVHYFDKKYNFSRPDSWYTDHFSEATEDQRVGEKTPDYFWTNGDGAEGHDPNVHHNIGSTLPDAKLIVMLRNPVDRAISAARHILRSGRISPRHSLNDLLLGERSDLLSPHGVLDYGHYANHLEEYFDLFSRDQVLILFFEEDLLQSPEIGIDKACQFLNVSFYVPEDANRKVNAHQASVLDLYVQYYMPRAHFHSRRLGILKFVKSYFSPRIQPPSEDTVQSLYQYYELSNERLRMMLDRPLPDSWQPTC